MILRNLARVALALLFLTGLVAGGVHAKASVLEIAFATVS